MWMDHNTDIFIGHICFKHTDHHADRKTTSFSLFVNVKNFVCRIGEDADVLMTLYDVKQSQFIR